MQLLQAPACSCPRSRPRARPRLFLLGLVAKGTFCFLSAGEGPSSGCHGGRCRSLASGAATPNPARAPRKAECPPIRRQPGGHNGRNSGTFSFSRIHPRVRPDLCPQVLARQGGRLAPRARESGDASPHSIILPRLGRALEPQRPLRSGTHYGVRHPDAALGSQRSGGRGDGPSSPPKPSTCGQRSGCDLWWELRVAPWPRCKCHGKSRMSPGLNGYLSLRVQLQRARFLLDFRHGSNTMPVDESGGTCGHGSHVPLSLDLLCGLCGEKWSGRALRASAECDHVGFRDSEQSVCSAGFSPSPSPSPPAGRTGVGAARLRPLNPPRGRGGGGYGLKAALQTKASNR